MGRPGPRGVRGSGYGLVSVTTRTQPVNGIVMYDRLPCQTPLLPRSARACSCSGQPREGSLASALRAAGLGAGRWAWLAAST